MQRSFPDRTQVYMPDTKTGDLVAGLALPTKVKRELARQMRAEMTAAEALLWQRLRAGLEGLHFRRQPIIKGLFPDFCCLQIRLVVEVDGGIHKCQDDYDKERDRVLRSLGFRVLRLKNCEVENDVGGVLS